MRAIAASWAPTAKLRASADCAYANETVLRALMLLGARDDQLEAVSFGNEKPAVTGSDEAAWAKNRRAELRDR